MRYYPNRMISLSDIHKQYGSKVLYKGASLQVKPGAPLWTRPEFQFKTCRLLDEQHLAVGGQRPMIVSDHGLECVGVLAHLLHAGKHLVPHVNDLILG